MKIHLNGFEHQAGEPCSLLGLVRSLGFDPRAVAVEHNLEVALRETWETTPVREGDQVEIVRFLGGG